MDAAVFRKFTDLMCCTGDVESLDFYLTSRVDAQPYVNFMNSDAATSMRIVDTIIPTHYQPLPSDMTGIILAHGTETLADINQRPMRFIYRFDDMDEMDAEDGWKYVTVTVPAGSNAYIYDDRYYSVTYIFTDGILQ
ncbi:Hypothetical protein POVR1_LOCUS129 [uncultured virus]|nr:Hypothetical protein POVR1_LOCUS129 [uncultured virus]